MRISVHGVGYRGVSEDALDNLGMLAYGELKSSEGVSKLVKGQGWEPSLRQEWAEVPISEVVAVHSGTFLTREDVAVIVPAWPLT